MLWDSVKKETQSGIMKNLAAYYWDVSGCSEILSNSTILSEQKDRALFLSALIGKAI